MPKKDIHPQFEIYKAVGLNSTSTVHGYLEKLSKTGQIKKDPTKPRALKIVGSKSSNTQKNDKGYYSSKELVDIPIVGKVTAGQPILAVENVEDTFPLPVDFVQNSTAFMLKVQGDSMIEAGILNKDLVLLSSSPQLTTEI